VRGRVDASGQPADDGHTGRRQLTRQTIGHRLTVAGRTPGADQRDRPRVPSRKAAAYEQHGRRISDVAQVGRIPVIQQRDRADAELRQPPADRVGRGSLPQAAQ